MKKIGKVSATEKCPTSNDDFTFWLDDNVEIRPFDIVKVEHESCGEISNTYAIVKEIFYCTDSDSHLANYISSDFGDLNCEPLTKKIGITYATADIINNNKDIYMPLRDGEPVSFANKEEIAEALGLNNVKNPIPAGFLEGSNGISVPISLNSEYLLGRQGAHLNISGISGLATKTSYAMFLLKSIQSKVEDVAIIVLNVKGADLLRLDSPNYSLTKEQIESWNKTGLSAEPFKNVKYFYPYKEFFGEKSYYANTALEEDALQKQKNEGNLNNYVYTYNGTREDLDLLFSNVDDPQFTMESILNTISENSDFDDLTWEDLKEKIKKRSTPKGERSEIAVNSWKKFSRILMNSINNDIFQKANIVSNKTCSLGDEICKISSKDVYVVDIAKLDEHLQYLVFGDVLRSVNKLKFGETARDPKDIPKKIIIFVDELNKYAGSSIPKNSPILRNLLEISERGRSDGIILFSAEQFKSDVHERITGNCSTHIYGRTNSIETSKNNYRHIPKVYRNMMTRLSKGDLILQHCIFSTPIKISFPYPAYQQSKEDD